MKKLLLIIPIIILISACGDIDLDSISVPKNPNSDNSSTTNPDGDGGTTNPGGDGGTTTNPDGDGDGTTTNPGGDGETTNPGGDGETTNPGGDGDGSGTTNPGGDGGDSGNGNDGTGSGGVTETFDYTKDPFASNLYYGRSLLSNDNEKAVYDHLVKKLLAFDVTDTNKDNYLLCIPLYSEGVKFDYYSSSRLTEIAKTIFYDEQRLTYISSIVPKGSTGSGFSYVYDSTDRKVYIPEACFIVTNVADTGGMYAAKLSETKAQHETEMAQVETGVKEILSKLKDDMTEAQKFRVLHDELIKRVSYGMKDEGTGDIRGAFIYNKVLCEGYARTLAYLCQRAGLECIYVVGTASYDGTGGSSSGSAFDHAWIKVKIDGQWYNVDPTNNDGMTPGSSYVYYNNFLQSDAEFMKDHKEGITTTGQTTSYAVIPKSAATSYDKNATDYP